MFSKLQWKIPTWKGLIGIIAMLIGVIGALTASPGTLPRPVEQWLIAAGALLLTIERVADAIDNMVSQKTSTPSVDTPTPPTV
jgi:hypothetical protein